MVSKRLAYLCAIVVGALCAIFIVKTNETFFDGLFKAGEMRTYNYNSMLLRFAKGQVRIKGKGGYIAYEGDVANGFVEGKGLLYDKDGNLVYDGDFSKSKYEGEGSKYYKNGLKMYEGQFSNNLYNGTGSQYREGGSLLYTGDFIDGVKEGQGSLFDYGTNQIYEGRFSKDDILYSELLNKASSDIGTLYTGSMSLFEDEDVFAILLNDIDALVVGRQSDEALSDQVKADTVYVLKQEIPVKDGTAHTPNEVTKYFGEPIFEGSSYITKEEALAIATIREQSGDKYYRDPSFESEYVYEDYSTITGYDEDMMVYLYIYERDGVEYTLVCSDENRPFGFYYLTKGNDGGDSEESDEDAGTLAEGLDEVSDTEATETE